ncbi:hypothetical protein [Methyloglobulus sp.]|uniref:hypothetical protein n=1 Tax=Methyloglobulus sp. TaxID=2518622 RepID=UPI0032B813D0
MLCAGHGKLVVVRLLTGFYIPCIWQEPIVVARCVATTTATLMWVLVPTDEILFFGRKILLHFSAKEKYPKEIRPMPLASCASRIYRGLPERTSLSFWQSAASLPHP